MNMENSIKIYSYSQKSFIYVLIESFRWTVDILGDFTETGSISQHTEGDYLFLVFS